MRMVIQRVKEASVRVDGKIVGQINKGALVLFGVKKTDIPAYTPWMAEKLIGLRYFSDAQGKMNLSLQDIQGEILIVSQFTLYANCNDGRRPGFDAVGFSSRAVRDPMRTGRSAPWRKDRLPYHLLLTPW